LGCFKRSLTLHRKCGRSDLNAKRAAQCWDCAPESPKYCGSGCTFPSGIRQFCPRFKGHTLVDVHASTLSAVHSYKITHLPSPDKMRFTQRAPHIVKSHTKWWVSFVSDLSGQRVLRNVASGKNWSARWAQIELHSRGVSGEYKMAIVGDCFLGRLEHRIGAGGCYSASPRAAPPRFASAPHHRSRRRWPYSPWDPTPDPGIRFKYMELPRACDLSAVNQRHFRNFQF
jgi:hypothetical protein